MEKEPRRKKTEMKTWVKWKLEEKGDLMDEDRNVKVGRRDVEGVHSVCLVSKSCCLVLASRQN